MKKHPIGLATSYVSMLLLVSLAIGCSKKEETQQHVVVGELPYEVSEDKEALSKLYKLDHIKEWYSERILPPVFDYSMDLSKKSVIELWLLRNEIFARNGYLFNDAVLRGYFNQYKWYQPIFEVDGFKVILNKQEKEFVDKVLTRERELSAERYVMQGGYNMINMQHVYNEMQFKSIDDNLRKMLAEKNMAIVGANHEQHFHVYDENHYGYIPSFVTTDIYLQLLHKHFSAILQKVEEEKFIPLLGGLLDNLKKQMNAFEYQATDNQMKNAARWSSNYLSIAHALIGGAPSSEPTEEYREELSKIMSAAGTGSEFLGSTTIQYSQFKPRGNYTNTKTLENYFRCVKWLNTAPIYINDDERFLSAVLIASIIKKNSVEKESFDRFSEAIKFIVGEEDNLSISILINNLSTEEANNPALLRQPEKLDALRKKIIRATVDRIRPAGGDKETSEALSQPAILFTAGRYTFDAGILSRLIHVLRPEPKRPFPKGLDIFASTGNKLAEEILLNDYQEAKQWKEFPDSLKKLKSEFTQYNDWNKNIYTKTFETIKAIDNAESAYPLFMKTPSWSKKNLITSLAAWTELKHDMLLYSEQPNAAQAGEGGGPPPPEHIGYVEPNVRFWEKAIELVNAEEAVLQRMQLITDNIHYVNEELKELGGRLLAISKKELAHEDLDAADFDFISWIGGSVEGLTFRIVGSDHLPEKERYVALVADVYNYNGSYLEEAVGMVDEIYVVAEINGKPYVTRGAVFSYYEFNNPQPLTDEEWIEQVSKTRPKRPAWVNDITINAWSLESKPGYSF